MLIWYPAWGWPNDNKTYTKLIIKLFNCWPNLGTLILGSGTIFIHQSAHATNTLHKTKVAQDNKNAAKWYVSTWSLVWGTAKLLQDWRSLSTTKLNSNSMSANMLKNKLCYKNEAGNKNRTLTLSVVGVGV